MSESDCSGNESGRFNKAIKPEVSASGVTKGMFMSRATGFMCAALALAAFGVTAHAADRSTSKKDTYTFGTLQAPGDAKVRLDAAAWLTETGKYDANRQAFDALWADKTKSTLDKVAGTFALGDADAAKLIADAKNPLTPAPTSLPAVLQEGKKSTFFRANLALAYSKALVNRKVFEESLETLKLFKAEQVIDPASFLFFKAVAEHGLMLKKEANETISRLLDDVPTAPERYRMVAALMLYDMLAWQERNILDKLGTIGRKMDNIQRRLALERGGKKTQKQQKDVVVRLDELIKEIENMSDSDCPNCPNGGNCPSGGQAKSPSDGKPGSNIQASAPQKDSNGGDGKGPGHVDDKKVKALAEVWGKLPARDREASMRELTRDMDPRYREVIMEYFRRLASQPTTTTP